MNVKHPTTVALYSPTLSTSILKEISICFPKLGQTQFAIVPPQAKKMVWKKYREPFTMGAVDFCFFPVSIGYVGTFIQAVWNIQARWDVCMSIKMHHISLIPSANIRVFVNGFGRRTPATSFALSIFLLTKSNKIVSFSIFAGPGRTVKMG